MHWLVLVDPVVKKQLKRFPKWDAERLIVAMEEFAVNPYAGNIERVEGERDVWRRRIGSYRIIYEVRTSEKIVRVFQATRRTSSTY